MPIRMIGFILSLLILLTFVGLNWDNTSDIDLWFNQRLHYEDVSIVLSFLIVFLLGMVSSIPFWVDLSIKKKKRQKIEKKKNEKKNNPVIEQREETAENAEDSQ